MAIREMTDSEPEPNGLLDRFFRFLAKVLLIWSFKNNLGGYSFIIVTGALIWFVLLGALPRYIISKFPILEEYNFYLYIVSMIIYLVIFTGLCYKASKWIPKKPLDGDERKSENDR